MRKEGISLHLIKAHQLCDKFIFWDVVNSGGKSFFIHLSYTLTVLIMLCFFLEAHTNLSLDCEFETFFSARSPLSASSPTLFNFVGLFSM